jgi:HSP20 family protein
MNRLVEQSLSRSRSPAEVAASGTWSPSVDIYETERHLVLRAELPEIEQKDIELRVHQNRLTLKGERRMSESITRERFHRMERAFGPFSRTFTLPIGVDPERATAELKEGVLKVTMPKTVDARSKPIPIG